MSPTDQVKTINLIEVLGNLRAKQPSRASSTHRPSLDMIGVRPHQVREGSSVWDLHDSLDGTDLVDGLDIRREATMDTEDLALDNCTKRKIIEYIGYVLPDIAVAVLSLDFIEESVELGRLTGFVVSS